jgi:hypothetical protein
MWKIWSGRCSVIILGVMMANAAMDWALFVIGQYSIGITVLGTYSKKRRLSYSFIHSFIHSSPVLFDCFVQ